MNIYNDRLGIKNNRKDYKSNIPLVLESADSTKMEKKEEWDNGTSAYR